jgi:methionyl-tRNA synthetase
MKTPDKVCDLMMRYKVSEAIHEIMTLAKRCNKYIDETLPWTLFKNEEDHERLKKVMYNLLEGIRVVSVLLYPFMPSTSDKIISQLNTKETTFASTYTFGKLEDGIKLGKPEILFNRIDTEKKLQEIEKSDKQKEQDLNVALIGIEDFAKIELKTAKIVSCEPVKGAKKLLKLQVETDNKTRQIVSGIAEYYTCDELIGKTVVVITNLKPAVLRGETSEGMLLAASDKDRLSLVTIDREMPTGSKIS